MPCDAVTTRRRSRVPVRVDDDGGISTAVATDSCRSAGGEDERSASFPFRERPYELAQPRWNLLKKIPEPNPTRSQVARECSAHP